MVAEGRSGVPTGAPPRPDRGPSDRSLTEADVPKRPCQPIGWQLRSVCQATVSFSIAIALSYNSLRARSGARQDVFDYIEFFYNPQRKHVRNGMLSPIAFEQQQKLKLQGV